MVAGVAVAAFALTGVFLADAPLGAVSCPASDAAHFTVTNNLDSSGAPPAGSLRAALASAMSASNPAVCIEAGVGTITLDPLAGPLNYAGLSALDVVGNGTTILGNGTFTLLHVGTLVPLSVDGLNMTGGQGAIAAFDVTISNSTFSSNVGGAVHGASIALSNDGFDNNTGGRHPGWQYGDGRREHVHR
jgi:hypothetical protein